MKNFSSKGIRFSGDPIKSCVGFIDLVDSTKNIAAMEGLAHIRKYYSTFINSVSNLISSNSSDGKVIKNIGDCVLFYFPKTSYINDANSFQDAIECCFKILDERYKINNELANEFILSSSNSESIKHILRNIEFQASKLGISFYQMMFILIQKDAIRNRKSQNKR